MHKEKLPQLVIGMLVVLLAITVVQSYQIYLLGTEIKSLKLTGMTPSQSKFTPQDILEITPKGTPDYGMRAGVSYDNVEQRLRTLMGYHQSLSLSGDEQQRYTEIATTEGTACEFCCGIGEAGFGGSDGRIACGCSHSVAFSGLTKWLIKNTEYTNQQIIDEIKKCKVLFFPRGSVQKELEKRNITPESVGLPAMRGGC